MTQSTLAALIEESALYGALTAGAPPAWLAQTTNAAGDAIAILSNSVTANPTPHRPVWTATEDAFVRDNYRSMTDAELAATLGRSVNAVKIRRERWLRLSSRSRRDDYLSARDVGKILGTGCAKTVAKLIDRGLLKGGTHALEAKIYAVSRHDLTRFALNPRNWIYFHPDRVTDPTLSRQITLRRARWNDEWWSVSQVAAYHGCHIHTVSHFIATGVIPAARWGNHWVLRSDATRAPIVSGKGNISIWTSRADAALIYARGTGLSWGDITRLTGNDNPDARLKYLWDKDRLLECVHTHRLGNSGLHIDPACRLLYVPYPHARGRFPFLDRAVDRFRAGQSLTPTQARALLGIMAAYAAWRAVTPDQHALAKRLESRAGITTPMLAAYYTQLQKLGFTLHP
jgi:hypothetical protein